MGADLEVGHTCSYLFDDSGTFVPQYSPGGNRWHVAFENVAVTRTMASVAACNVGFGFASNARLPGPK